jgi:cell division protein FtsL
MMLAATATVLTLLTVVAFNVVLAQSQLSIDRLDQQTTNAQQRYEDLRLKYADLSSPARIVARAQKLGLVAAAQPPTAIPTAGALPPSPAASSTTLKGYSDVKSTLATSP